MNTQTLTNPAIFLKLFTTLSGAVDQPAGPIRAAPRDYGFDFDEDELACELPAPLPDGLTNHEASEAHVDEFESRYLWFLS